MKFLRSSLALALGAHFACAEDAPDFAKEIRPILEKNCFECHGEKKQKGGLRMDRRADILQGGDSAKAPFEPGKSDVSDLIVRVTSADDDEKMPPKGERLAPELIAKLKTWIDAGALIAEDGSSSQAKHWAYVKPEPRALPDVQNAAWCRSGIDRWIAARLEKEKLLAPSPEAERAILLRRVSLDLTGLPPTLAEVDAFLADAAPDAYEKVVDRLLASPSYGERWARPWLDLARYADTQGYEKDNRRSMWPYRDWLIAALDRDEPFDQFTIEQIAGDLLPNATQDQKIATGFHRNTMTNTEGGTDNEEFRYEALVDRVNTTFGAWMGTTMACAQCHNHKYDPILTKEYYQAMAFLNNTADADNDDESPTMKVITFAQEQELQKLRAAKDDAEKKARDFASSLDLAKGQAAWEKSALAATWEPIEITDWQAEAGTTLTKLDDGSLRASGATPPQGNYILTARTPLRGITAFRLEALTDPLLPAQGPGRSDNGNIILTEFKVAANGQPVALSRASADFSQDGYPIATSIDGNPQTGWAWSPQFGKNHEATFTVVTPLGADGELALVFRLEHQNKEWPRHILGKFRLSATTSPGGAAAFAIPPEVLSSLKVPSDQRDAKQAARVLEFYRSVAPETQAFATALATAQKALDDFETSLPKTSVMIELPKPRVTKRHVRGGYLNVAEEVQPGVPAALHPFPKNAPQNRLGFAEWLVDRENPLTARVIVNRAWEQFFGKGIVETVEEFGKQGEPPSHPELLDWLALQFMDGSGSGKPWSTKALHKLIVMSATYRQSSKVSPELRERDPNNRLLARGPRVRLEAEVIRDQALAAAGLLSHKIGGPSVMPPQPAGIWQMVYNGDDWKLSSGEDKYRRGLYTFYRRSSPYPMMASFDAPSREFCVLRRNRSNTPLQALNTLNDPAFVEAAQALARKIAAVPDDNTARAEFAFRSILSRLPKADETARVVALFESERTTFASDAGAAEKMACSEVGKPADASNLADLAAWTVVANILLNLDEAITKS